MSKLTVDTIKTNSFVNPDNVNCINISSTGIASFPQKPCFFGWRDTGKEVWESFGTTPVTYNYNTVGLNRGNYYNVTNGTFLVPQSGVYAVNCGMLHGQAGGYASLFVYVNNVVRTARGVHSNTNGYNLWTYNSQTFLVRCNKDDILEVRIYTTNAGVYGREHSQCSIWMYS